MNKNNEKISKELVSSILGINIEIVYYIEDELIGLQNLVMNRSMNIYELMNKCKKRALEMGYYLESSIYNSNQNIGICKVTHVYGSFILTTEAQKEYDAVFKAYQLLLEKGLK